MSRRKTKKLSPRKLKLYRARQKALSQPITMEEKADFSSRLFAVHYGRGTCWIYPGKSTSGVMNDYARKWFRGQWVGAHRFALAIKLGCTLWDFEGFEAGHASKSVCMGGRCCNPDHLSKQTPPLNRWQRSADYRKFGQKEQGKLSPEDQKKFIRAMYPDGIPTDQKVFDEPWQSNASPELLQFLEMGFRNDLRNMQETRDSTAQPSA